MLLGRVVAAAGSPGKVFGKRGKDRALSLAMAGVRRQGIRCKSGARVLGRREIFSRGCQTLGNNRGRCFDVCLGQRDMGNLSVFVSACCPQQSKDHMGLLVDAIA